MPDIFVGNIDTERDTLDVSLLFRHGLPWNAQFEASIPLNEFLVQKYDLVEKIVVIADGSDEGLITNKIAITLVSLSKEIYPGNFTSSPNSLGFTTTFRNLKFPVVRNVMHSKFLEGK